MDEKDLRFETIVNIVMHDDKKFGELISQIDKFANENHILKDNITIMTNGMNTIRLSLVDAEKTINLKDGYIYQLEREVTELKDQLRKD